MDFSWDDYNRTRFERGKKFRDPLYDFINLGYNAVEALDTPPLQRLRHLKQLGCSSAVYPCGEHSRFVHSLGVAHLAHDMLKQLRERQPELEVRPVDMHIIELGGLCHDLGHGPYSHVFENEFLARMGIKWSHEVMSIRLIDRVVDESSLDLDSDAVQRIKDVVGSGKVEGRSNWDGREFMLQIVANSANGVDVDKFDYLRRDAYMCGVGSYEFAGPLIQAARVVDGAIAFKNGMEPKLHSLFSARAEMHQQVYTHRKVKSVEYLVVDAMVAANGPLRISERIHDPDDFISLTDALLMEIRNSGRQELQEAAALVARIDRRDVYRFCAEFDVPQDRALEWVNMTAEEVAGCQEHNSGYPIRAEDIRVHNLKIDYSMGGSHPARRVPIWHWSGRVELCSELPFSPALCLERKVRVYLAKDIPDPVDRLKAIRAVQAAVENAARRRLGSSIRVILGGGERQPAASSRSALSGGATRSWQGQQQRRRQPASSAGGGAEGASQLLSEGDARTSGCGVAGHTADGGGVDACGARLVATPEKLPPGKRGPGSPRLAGCDSPGEAGHVGPREICFSEALNGSGGARQRQQQQQQRQKTNGRAAQQDPGDYDSDDEEADGLVLTQESASVAGNGKRRKAAVV